MTAEIFSATAGVVLSLLFAYIPGLNTWYGGLESQKKSLIMLGLLVLVSGGAVGIACAGFAGDLGIAVSCDKSGFIMVGKALLAAAVANQTTYLLSPEANKVRLAKVSRG